MDSRFNETIFMSEMALFILLGVFRFRLLPLQTHTFAFSFQRRFYIKYLMDKGGRRISMTSES
jgi:hypothetical protein